jgi:hypothetical protein
MDLVMVAMGGLLCVAFAAFGVVAVVTVVVGRRGFQAFTAAVAQDPDWTVTLLGELPPGSAVRWGPDGLFLELPREGWLVDARSAAQLGAVADRVGALAEALRGTA